MKDVDEFDIPDNLLISKVLCKIQLSGGRLNVNNILHTVEELPVIMHIFAFPNIFSFSRSLFSVYKANLLQRICITDN